jgi:hypothetical protein
MTRRRKDPLRDLTPDENRDLESISHARSAPAEAVTGAKILLSVAAGMTDQDAARSAGRKSGDAVSALVSRFKQAGLDALVARHGGGGLRSNRVEPARIRRGFQRQPIPAGWNDTWSLTRLRRALRQAEMV